MRRRTLVAAGALALAALAAPLPRPAQAQETDADAPGAPAAEFDRVLGDADAPVTIIEYASFTCPHCADFHTNTLPTLKEQFIDTGVAKLVFRDFPLDRYALFAGQIARCLPEEQYFPMVGTLFSTQGKWARADDPVQALKQIAGMAGLSADRAQACLDDSALGDSILQSRLQGQQQFEINATPTFIVNGEKVSGSLPVDEFVELIQKHAADEG